MSGMQLSELVERARAHRMSPKERQEQRLSLVMGFRGKHSTLTREKAKEVLDDTEGRADSNDCG